VKGRAVFFCAIKIKGNDLQLFAHQNASLLIERAGGRMSVEQQAIERLKSGDGSALKWLMKQYGNDILRTAALLLKDHHLAEDVSQEVFITAFQKINQYRGDGSLRGWLLQMTINRCRSKMRLASWKRLLFRETTGEEMKAHSHMINSTDAEIERWALSLSLRETIEAMPLKYREVILLYYYQELTIKEIAQVLGESENTIKSKLLRGRKLLRHQLEEGGWQDETRA
jgi:RNA polymerase sigma-70 factor (ECF subfamily)